jgi:hypothetical protein
MNRTLKKAIIAIIITALFWAQLPQAALAGTASKTHNPPQVLTTLEENLNGHQDKKPGSSGNLLRIIVGTLAVAMVGALLGSSSSSGGGSKGSSSDPNNDDSSATVSAEWGYRL